MSAPNSAQKLRRAPPKEPPPAEVIQEATAGGTQQQSAQHSQPVATSTSSNATNVSSSSSSSSSTTTSAASTTSNADLAIAQSALLAYGLPDPNPSQPRYQLVKLIGKGAYGAVYVALERVPGSTTPRKVAIKHIINAFVSPTDARRIYREIKVMAHFSHVNSLALLEVIKPRDPAGFSHIYLVCELMETDLHRVIHSRQDLTSDHISFFIYQTLCALKHIHKAGVLHRDLKPSNLLVNADCTVKMCDFGLARESDSSLSAALTEYVVTRWYRAPEVLLSGGRYTQAIDVWSVGCILGELLLRRPFFPGENYLHQLQLITEVLGSPTEDDLEFVKAPAARNFMLRLPRSAGIPFSTLLPHVKGACPDLLRRMLAFDPAKRATVDECLAHPFFARVRSARKSVNEDVPPAKPFRLRVQGGSAALKSMTVDAIKQRFYAELCGIILTPTPTDSPKGPDGLFGFGTPTLGGAALASAPQNLLGSAAATAAAVSASMAASASTAAAAVSRSALPQPAGSAMHVGPTAAVQQQYLQQRQPLMPTGPPLTGLMPPGGTTSTAPAHALHRSLAAPQPAIHSGPQYPLHSANGISAPSGVRGMAVAPSPLLAHPPPSRQRDEQPFAVAEGDDDDDDAMSGFEDDDDESLFTDEDDDDDESQQAMPAMPIHRSGGAGAMPHAVGVDHSSGYSGMFTSTSSSPQGANSSPQTSPFRSSTLPLPGMGARQQVQAVTDGMASLSTDPQRSGGSSTPAAGVVTSAVRRGGMEF